MRKMAVFVIARLSKDGHGQGSSHGSLRKI